MKLFGLKTYILSQISHKQSDFESLRQYYFEKPYICLGVQSHPEDQGDLGQCLTVNIWECNNQIELGVYNMCCSYMVLTNPHVKPWIQFIIMKIFMKIVQICPKSPRFTVLKTFLQRSIKQADWSLRSHTSNTNFWKYCLNLFRLEAIKHWFISNSYYRRHLPL